jgi:anti-anti-sigma regulatory factor
LAIGKKLAKTREAAPARSLPRAKGKTPAPKPRLAGNIAAAAASLGSVPAVEPAVSMPPAPDPVPSADAVIRLGAQCTIREAVPLRAELLARVDAVEPVWLDAAGVQKVDTAGLQVLLAFRQQRQVAGGATEWTGCSEAFRKAAATIALTRALGLTDATGC